MKTLSLIASLTMLAVSTSAFGAGDPVAGQSKATLCIACHGSDGNSVNPQWPKLAGQHPAYTVKQLLDLKASEDRTNLVMAPMVATLSEQDMEDIAAFYAAQVRTGGYASAERAQMGAKVYRGGNLESGLAACMGCHGPSGAGNPLGGFPALAGQHAEYVLIQLKAFRSGERKNDPSGMMRDVARWMTDAEMEAVAEYVAGLH